MNFLYLYFRMNSLNGLNYNVKLINFKLNLILNVREIHEYMIYYISSLFISLSIYTSLTLSRYRLLSSKKFIGCSICRFNPFTPRYLRNPPGLLLFQPQSDRLFVGLFPSRNRFDSFIF